MFCPNCGTEMGWSLRGALGIREVSLRRVLLVLAIFVGIALVLLAAFIPCYLRSESLDRRDVELAAMGYRAVRAEGDWGPVKIVPMESEEE